MKYIKLFEEFVNEATDTIEKSIVTNGKKVSFMPGRFQPFHLGHIEALKNLSKKTGNPVIPLQIVSKSAKAKGKSPLPTRLLQRIGDDIVKNNKFIEDFYVYDTSEQPSFMPDMLRFLRDRGYEGEKMGSGSDRLQSWKGQLKYVGDDTDTETLPKFGLELVDVRDEDGPSGTKVREAIKADDKEAFEEMVPSYLHKYYNELKKYIK